MCNRKDPAIRKMKQTSELLKVILGSYVIIIGIYVICMCVIGDMTYVTEVLIRTGDSLGIAVLLVMIVEALQRADQKRSRRKRNEILLDQTNSGLLRCSSAYYMLPTGMLFIDLMLAALLWQGYRWDFRAYADALSADSLRLSMMVLAFLHMCSVFVIFYYGHRKVYYTDYEICLMKAWKKTQIWCSDIKKITYCHSKKGDRIFIESSRQLELRADQFTDGWKQFMIYICAIADRYQIELVQETRRLSSDILKNKIKKP